MEVAQPAARCDQCRFAVHPSRPGSGATDGAAVEVGQNFPTSIVKSEHARRTGEADHLEVTQQRLNGGRLRTSSPTHGVPDPYGAIVAAAGQPLLHAIGAYFATVSMSPPTGPNDLHTRHLSRSHGQQSPCSSMPSDFA
jgi:hypothetical protein